MPKGDAEKVNTLGGTLGVVDAALESAPLDLTTKAGAELVGKTVGYAGFALQTTTSALDVVNSYKDYKQGSMSENDMRSHWIKDGADVAVGVVALTSPEGAAIGAIYFVADQTGAMEGITSLPETAYEMMVWQAWNGMSIANPMNH